MSFDERVKALWLNPKAVDLNSPFLYFISTVDHDGYEYRYIGKAGREKRLREYRNNMLKIKAGRERGTTQNYRAVHLALFIAIDSGRHF